MISLKARKIVLIALLVVSFISPLPISVRLGDPLFTYPFRTGWQYDYPVLLVWPDRVEVRWFHDISELSPRPLNAHYTFSVAPERQAWVENEVRSTPGPNGADSGWVIHVKQLGPSRQQIQLELLRNGITGLIYEVREDKIVPLRSRLAGPLGSLSIMILLLLLWAGIWVVVWLVSRLVKRRCQQRSGVFGRAWYHLYTH